MCDGNDCSFITNLWDNFQDALDARYLEYHGMTYKEAYKHYKGKHHRRLPPKLIQKFSDGALSL